MTTDEMDAPLRPTGYMERFNILRNHVKFYNNVQVAATYTVPRSLLNPLSVKGLESLIYAALRETLDHQPIMGVTIEDEGNPEPRWVRLKTIDLREVVKLVEVDLKSDALGWVRDGHKVPFDRLDELPLWRVVVAHQDVAVRNTESETESFTVGCFCHHAIADGLSAGAFHLTFLDALNHLIANGIHTPADPAIIKVPKLPLVPNLELATPLPVGIFFALKQIINAYVYSPIDPLNWSGPLISADIPRPPISNLRTFSLPHSIVNSLLSQCRNARISITALVTVLVARKLASMYPTHSRFTGNIPFSLRKFTGHTARDMGCYVSTIEPLFSSESNPPRGYISCRSSTAEPGKADEQLWNSARETKKFISERSATTRDQAVGLLKFVSDFPKFFYGMFGTKRAHAFEVTNIGVLDGGVRNEKDRAFFDSVLFSSASCTFGHPYDIHLASVKDGEMSVACTWETGVVEDERAVELAVWLEEALRGLATV